MAEAFIARQFPGAVVESAGLGALVGSPADPLAVKCMKERGLDIGGHVARQITPEMLREATLVLTASREHQVSLERAHSWVVGRVFRLGHWSGRDIQDPYQMGEPAFRSACDAIFESLLTWIPRLEALAPRPSSVSATPPT